MNGKQLKKLKKKKRLSEDSAAAFISQQKHEAQLAGAAEAVPLKLKQAKLAQRQQPADLQDMDTALQPSSSDKPTKRPKKKRSKSSDTAEGSLQGASIDWAPLSNGHDASASLETATASQKKKRVRFAMKRNLMMQIGGAVPPEEIRTPPDSRPKVCLWKCWQKWSWAIAINSCISAFANCIWKVSAASGCLHCYVGVSLFLHMHSLL